MMTNQFAIFAKLTREELSGSSPRTVAFLTGEWRIHEIS